MASLPQDIQFGLDFSSFFAPFQTDPNSGNMALLQVFLQPTLLFFCFSFLMSDFFDTMGTMVAIAEQGDFINKKGEVSDSRTIFIVDSCAAALGGLLGASSITTCLESATGAAAGARTGLSSIVIALLFFACMFLGPFIGVIPGAATTGALVVVGYLMIKEITKISWDSVELAFPAFITIVMIPFTYSIPNGIGLGFISYTLISACTGHIKEIKPLMWICSISFLVYFIAAL